MDTWLNSLSVKELRIWIKNFENSYLTMFLDNAPSEEDIAKAREILKNKLKK